MAIDAEGAEFDLGIIEPDRGLVRHPHGVDVALLVAGDIGGIGGFGIGQRRLLGDAAGDTPANFVGVEIEPRFGIRTRSNWRRAAA